MICHVVKKLVYNTIRQYLAKSHPWEDEEMVAKKHMNAYAEKMKKIWGQLETHLEPGRSWSTACFRQDHLQR
ncbi:hypothetical protein DPMN_164803 [Dreissena polymorpha]|uniref:Uncharacterized protein n=1 Tax=Dreissena polymorpha TaxID=45954 RepID=A0A9D4IVS3_DREPO|nr:hypothetical protein DPMN_164803 [Dreissena polymorpha]